MHPKVLQEVQGSRSSMKSLWLCESSRSVVLICERQSLGFGLGLKAMGDGNNLGIYDVQRNANACVYRISVN